MGGPKSSSGFVNKAKQSIKEGSRRAGKGVALKMAVDAMNTNKNPTIETKRHHEAKTKRLDHYPWPDHWTRARKRACVQACKRAKKKGFTPNTPAWDAELAGAGFNPKVIKEDTDNA